MAAVLGISANYHDAAAALVVDGAIVAAMQEERFSRIKNDPRLPLSAAAACLSHAGLQPGDLDEVVFYENPYAKMERILTSLLRGWPRTIRSFGRAVGSQIGGKLWVLDALARGIGVPRDRVTFRDHHRSHAASAYYASPFARAAVLTVDAVGEQTTTALWRGEGTDLVPLQTTTFPHSLGLLYSALTAYLGFEVNEGEYKVMGLAAFGTPRFEDAFAEILRLQPGTGRFSLDLDYFAIDTDSEVGFSPRLEALLGPRRPPRAPWDLDSDTDRRYADIAATLQATTERALLDLAKRARALTDAEALCMAGGVALNAVANARIAAEAGFAELFVQPAAGDAGGALGAALLGAIDRGDPRPAFTSAALGLPVRSARAAEIARAAGFSVARADDPVEAAAQRVAAGEIVGLCEGRFEWGPRALGHRSLIALPGPASVRDRLNGVVKRREPFRPFAPAVRAASADRWFGPCAPWLARFMLTTAPVRDEDALQATTHVDGTARLQIVPGEGPFAQLIARVGALTDVDVVLNTSLNGRGEPIVASEADAIAFLSSHPIDAIVVGDAVITRS